jgi:hypothetical protein
MMNTYRINSTGNTIIADQAFMDANYPGDYTLIPDPVAPPPFYQWYLDLGSYYDRFGAAKLLVLSSADAIVKAAISDASIRNYIDLQRTEVQAVVTYMSGVAVPGLGTIAAQLITPAEATTILTTVPDSSEQLKTIAYLKSVGLL